MKKWPWKKDAWKKRAKMIRNLIGKEDRILDLGGGVGGLRELVPHHDYVSVDKKKWTKETIVADFNKWEYPDVGRFDILICQGIIEYMENPLSFLQTIKIYGKKMIATYYFGENNVSERKNFLSPIEIEMKISNAGWKISERQEVGKLERLYICTL